VVGLGRRWRRLFGPALEDMGDQWTINAVYDPITRQADAESRRLNVDRFASLLEMFERPRVDAVLLTEMPWFGPWPLVLARRFRQPLYCGASLVGHIDSIPLEEPHGSIMTELRPRDVPITPRLRELLAADLGPAHLIVVQIAQPIAPHPGRPTPDYSTAVGHHGLALVDWASGLFGGWPETVSAVQTRGVEFASAFFQFADNKALQLTCGPSEDRRISTRVRIWARHGVANLDYPHRLAWTVGSASHLERPVSPRPLTHMLLSRFHDHVTRETAASPSLADIGRLSAWQRAIRESSASGQRIELRVP
jgi:predicted dehydrogenase